MDYTFWAERWARGHPRWDRGEPSAALQHWFAQGTARPGSLFVPGCGSGHEVLWLARKGVAVTAVDIVAAPLKTLRARLHAEKLSATLVQADLFTWTPPERFDAIYEQTCLCAIAPRQRREYAQRMHDWLRPRGTLYALLVQTPWDEGPPWHCDAERMRASVFPESHWRWPAHADFVLPHPAGFTEHGYRLSRR